MSENSSPITLSSGNLALLLTFVFSLAPVKVVLCAALFVILYGLFTLNQIEVELLPMESKAVELLGVLKNPNLSIDAKVAHLTGLKSDIKQKNVPEGAVPSVFECLRASIGSSHQPLLASGFSTLGHFIKRLTIQGQHGVICLQSRTLYPVLLERLGDHKERIRAQAAQAFTDLWPAASAEVEHYVLEVALVGKNTKAKEMSMIWLSSMTKSHGLLFRSYVPSLVACLEDADSSVRDTAKLTVVELFQNAPSRAKSDLQKQLSIHNVRRSIANGILASIGLPTDEPSISRAESYPTRPPSRGDALIQRSASRPPSRGDALIQRPTPARPPSRGDALIQRPASRADAPVRPPSRGDVLIQRPIPVRPPSRGDALHQRAIVSAENQLSKTPSRGDALHQSSLSVVPANNHSDVDAPREPQFSSHNEVATNWTEPANDRQQRTVPALSKTTQNTQVSSHDSQEGEQVEPLNISSSRQVDDMVYEMLLYFEGRESEDNWLKREKAVLRLRRLTHGNAPHAYSQQYLTAIKTLLDGIFKVVTSLRTTLSTNGLFLVQDLARVCGPKIDTMVEIIMQNLIKLCGGMKKITAGNGKATVDAVLQNVTYTHRLLHHVSSAALDRNAQLRLCASGWLQTLINRQADHKSSIEHGGGLDALVKCIKNGVTDANAEVRVAMRDTFWTFYHVWPEEADQILSDLDKSKRSMLEKHKHPSNPNAGQASSKQGLTSSTTGSSRSTLKAVIAAQKKARLSPAKSLPAHPESARGTLPETKSSTKYATNSSGARTVPASSGTSSLSSAPVRPATKAKRPEVARPATADPYATRRVGRSTKVDGSPRVPRLKSASPSKSSLGSGSSVSSTTNSKPKKLDLTGTRNRERPLAANHQRSDSQESAGSQSSVKSHPPIIISTSHELDSPASVQLESPTDYGIHPREPDGGDHISSNGNILISEDYRNAPENQTIDQFSHVLETDLNALEGPSIISSGNTTKQPEELLIYEDPVSPAIDRQGDHADAIPNERDSHMMPHEATEQHFEQLQRPPTPVKQHGRERSLDAPPQQSLELEHSTSSSANIELNTGHPNLEPQSGPGTPVTVKRVSLGAAETYEPLGLGSPTPKTTNNENTTPNLRKFALTFTGRPSAKHNALEELPSNEPDHRDNTPVLHVQKTRAPTSDALDSIEESRRWKKFENFQRRRSISPRSGDPVKAREMIEKGIQRIRTGTMEIVGYRKLQGLIEYHDTIFVDEAKYDEMLLALLDELESPVDMKKNQHGRPLDLKTQVLLTIRFMLTHNKKYFSAYHPRAMSALITARKHYSSHSHIIRGMEETIDEIIQECEPCEVIEAIIEVLLTEEASEEGNRAMEMGMEVLAKFLFHLSERHVSLPEYLMERLGSLAAQKLSNSDPDVRLQVTRFCVRLRSMVVSENQFWQVLGWPQDSTKHLLAYYIESEKPKNP